MPFSLKHVNYILAVERTGSVTAAANQLFISQPALSQVIRQVERDRRRAGIRPRGPAGGGHPHRPDQQDQ